MAAIPVTSQFPLADWNGGVTISDPTQGLLLCSDYSSNQSGSPFAESYFDLELDSVTGVTVGASLDESTGPTWQSTVISITGSTVRVRLTAGVAPAVGDVTTVPAEVLSVVGVLALDALGSTYWGSLPLGFPSSATLELRISLTSIPDPSDALVFGFVNQPDKSALLRLSTDGISVVSGPTATAVPLAGSSAWLSTGDITIRLVMDTDKPLSYLYITNTSQVGVTGQVLAYTLVCPAPEASLVNQFQFYLSGNAAFELKTLRVSDIADIPDQQPVAVLGDDQAVSLGEHVFLDGRDSYDPENQELSHLWEILEVPSGSNITLQDAGSATGSYQVPAPGPLIEVTAKTAGSAANGQRLLFQTGSSFSIAEDTDGVLVTYDHTLPWPTATKMSEFLSAWTDPTDPAYSSAVDAKYELELTGTALNTIPLSDVGTPSVVLAGGADGTGATNYFDPDTIGVYRIGLTVSDGSIQSDQVIQINNIIAAGVEMGYVPDGEMIWKYVSDWWLLLKDKEPFAHVYSSMVQQATGLLNEAWQHERAFSLATVPRRFQKRWLDYDISSQEELEHVCGMQASLGGVSPLITTMDPPDFTKEIPERTKTLYYTSRHFADATDLWPDPLADHVAGDSVVVHSKTEGTSLQTLASVQPITVTGSVVMSMEGSNGLLQDSTRDFAALGVSVNDIVQVINPATGLRWAGAVAEVRTNARTLVLKNYTGTTGSSLTYFIGGYVSLEEQGVPKYAVMDSARVSGYRDPAHLDRWYQRGGITFDPRVTVGDYLRIYDQYSNEVLGYWEITAIASDDSYIELDLTVAGALPNAYGLRWEVLSFNSTYTTAALSASPVFESEEELEDSIFVGDTVELDVEYAGVEYRTQALVSAVSGRRFSACVSLLQSEGPTEGTTVLALLRQSTTLTNLTYVATYHTHALAAPDDTDSIPRLQRGPGEDSDPLLEARDFYVADESITWVPVARGTVQVYYEKATLTPYEELTLLTGSTAGIQIGDVIHLSEAATTSLGSIHSVVTGVTSTAITIAAGTDTTTLPRYPIIYDFVVPNRRLFPLPEKLWAELTYLDNSAQIENNFGLAVGLPAEAVQDNELNLDYLSSVQALWLVAWSGPTVANLELGTKVFFNLPFAQESGEIIGLEPSYSAEKGRIVIQSTISGNIHTYFYPLAIGLGTNPDTDELWELGDTVPIFSALTAGVEVLDYVDDPDWIKGRLEGPQELRKYHTFGLRINLEGQTDIASSLELTDDFIQRTKPEHTDVIVIGAFNLQDEIAVGDTVFFGGTMRLEDEPYTCADIGTQLPTSGSEAMRSGFVHRLGAFDGEGNQPMELFYEHSNKERELLWLETSGTDSFTPGEMIYESTGSVLQVRFVGEGFVVANYVPATFEVLLGDTTGWTAGGTMQENSGACWTALITKVVASTSAILAIDTQIATTKPLRIPVAGDATTTGGPLTAVTEQAMAVPQAGWVYYDAAGNSRTIVAVHTFPDLISDFDRSSRVGPESFAEARSKFQVGGNPQQLLNLRGTVIPTDILREDAVDPTWYARILASFEV